MFGKRSTDAASTSRVLPSPAAPVSAASMVSEPKAAVGKVSAAPVAKAPNAPAAKAPNAPAAGEQQRRHSEEYYDVKTTVFNALIDTIDLTQLAKLEAAAAREEILSLIHI